MSSTILSQSHARIEPTTRFIGGTRFDWVIALLASWMIGGLYLDAWAHHVFTLETFFSPWHAILYSGFLLLATVLVSTAIWNVTHGAGWRAAMPRGYALSLVGVGLFMVGGVADLVWHSVFGIEDSIEWLLSPPHLFLAFGGGLIVTGPLRAALVSEDDVVSQWRMWLPAARFTHASLVGANFFHRVRQCVGRNVGPSLAASAWRECDRQKRGVGRRERAPHDRADSRCDVVCGKPLENARGEFDRVRYALCGADSGGAHGVGVAAVSSRRGRVVGWDICVAQAECGTGARVAAVCAFECADFEWVVYCGAAMAFPTRSLASLLTPLSIHANVLPATGRAVEDIQHLDPEQIEDDLLSETDRRVELLLEHPNAALNVSTPPVHRT